MKALILGQYFGLDLYLNAAKKYCEAGFEMIILARKP